MRALRSDHGEPSIVFSHWFASFQVSLERGKNIIICVLMPNITIENLPPTLRMIIKTVTCLSWPRDPRAQKVFWLKLREGLQEGAPDVRQKAGDVSVVI